VYEAIMMRARIKGAHGCLLNMPQSLKYRLVNEGFAKRGVYGNITVNWVLE
jgi:hypothetical protein